MRRSAVLMLLASLGCASTRATEARDEVTATVAARSGLEDAIAARDDEESRDRVQARVDALLAEPLTVDAAMRVALLNNRALQATLEELGVAQAELVQAGLLENPTIGGDVVISTRGNGLGGGLGLSQSLLSAFLIPAKRRIARANLQKTTVEVSDAALALVRDVKIAYADVQAAAADRDLHRAMVQATEVADELAARLLAAGNITELDRQVHAAELDHARLELADAELELTTAREQLNRELGLWGPQVGWKLATPLSDPPAEEADLSRVEQVGIEQRLDLSAARFEVESIDNALKLRRRGLVPMIEAGVEARNEVGDDEGHEWVVGPALAIELPIFDPGHADIARIGSMLRQAQHRLQGMAVDARATIREHRAALLTARAKTDYLRDTVLPRRKTIGQHALERYNAMLIGAYELIEVRQAQLESQREYVEARHDYWIRRAELEFAVGGRLP